MPPSRSWIEQNQELYTCVDCMNCRYENLCVFRQELISILAARVDRLRERASAVDEPPTIKTVTVTGCDKYEPV